MTTLMIPCPQCHALNRVPAERLSEGPVCGKCKASLLPGAPIEVDATHFSRHVLENGLPVVVDFWAPWCGPCRMMAPHFAEAARMMPNVHFVKVNTEDNPSIAAQYGIRSIPTLALFANGKEIARQSGAMPAQALVHWLRSML